MSQVDAAGNAFVAGDTYAGDRHSLFVTKFNCAGAHLWTARVEGEGHGRVSALQAGTEGLACKHPGSPTSLAVMGASILASEVDLPSL